MVSWISAAIRWRSSSIPASRACARSCAWRPVFSASACSSRATVSRRASFCSATRSPTSVPALSTTVWTTMMTSQKVQAVAVFGSPASSEFTRMEVIAMAATVTTNGRSAVA